MINFPKYLDRICLSIVVMLLFLCAACNQRPNPEQSHTISSSQTEEASLPDLSIFHLEGNWTTESKREIKLADLQGEVLVMALIFTTCQYACPRLVADMKAIEETVPKEELDKTNFVLVSIDPERDLPDTLRLFAQEKELDLNHWTLLNGHPDDVLELAVVLGVKYKKVSAIDFSHSNIISLFNAKGELVYQQEGFGTDNSEFVAELNKELKKFKK